jgi:hypothetical protein
VGLEPTVTGFVAKDAVTPLGRPEIARCTLPVNPFCGSIYTEGEVVPPWPTVALYAAIVKLGANTLTLIVVLADNDPEIPVIVTAYCPSAAVLLAVNVRVLLYPLVMGFGENDAVTPLGKPATERVTLPLNPFTELKLT